MRYLLFEDIGIDGGPHTFRYSEEEAINEQKRNALNFHKYVYESDEEALLDFIAVNWAWYEDQK